MKKVLGITFGGLQKRILGLVLLVLVVMALLFAGVSVYQNHILQTLVEQTRQEQQQAISGISKETMLQVQQGSLVNTVSLQAAVADADFSEVVNDLYTLQHMAEALLEDPQAMEPVAVGRPEASMDGTASAYALSEEGVDPAGSELLGILGHLSAPMIAMHECSEKIDGLYIGLEDGTDLCVDDKALSKLDEAGGAIAFPVRQRPWYRGAVEADGLYFTGIIRDMFSSALTITCSVPVKANGVLVGVAGIDIVLSGVNDFMQAASESGVTAFIMDGQGQVLLSSQEEGVFAAAEEAQPERDPGFADVTALAQAALSHTTDLQVIALDGREYYIAGAPMPTVGWAAVMAVDKEWTEEPEQRMLAAYDEINARASEQFAAGTSRSQRMGNVLLLAIIALGVAAAFVTARRVAGPIEQMTRDITDSGNTGELFHMKDSYRTNDEIELLALSFDDLSQKTRQYIDHITRITAEKERIGTELRMANLIQASMMPHVFPPYPNRPEFDLYASMDPAREVGGDFYDYFLIDDDHLCMVIADVSGKGVPAALFMMVCKVILQSCAMLGRSAGEILTKTNEAICSNNQAEMFVTVWLGILQISTGEMTCASAGHEYPAIRRKGGNFQMFRDIHGFVIGGMPGTRYREYELQLHRGDQLFVYTDGLPEAMNDAEEMFGTQRMVEALNEDADASAQQTLQNVRRAVDDFVQQEEPFDDLTMLCLEYKGGKPTAEQEGSDT